MKNWFDGIAARLDEARSLLEDYGMGFAGRLDTTGVRAKGMPRRPIGRAGDFPYDRQITYGQPMAYDRGSSGEGPSHRGITPKDTAHSAWDEVEEAMGTPMFLGKADAGQIGNATLVPGAIDGWASHPKKPEDESDVSDKDLERAGHEEMGWDYDQGHKFEGYLDVKSFTQDPTKTNPEPIPTPPKVDLDIRAGDDPRDLGKSPKDRDVMVIGTAMPFRTGLGTAQRTLRATGMIPRESAWDVLSRLFGTK